MLDIDQVRAETPGCKEITHLNSAGAGLMPQPVIDAIQSYIEYESITGGYAAAEFTRKEIQQLYQLAGQFLNCSEDEVAFTGSATDSYNRALSCIPFEEGDVILTTTNDYSSNQIAFLGLAKRFGIKIVKIHDTPNGEIDLNDLEHKLKSLHPKLLAITHIPTNSGLIQPIVEIGEIVRSFDTLYIVDACQTIGQLQIDCQKLYCHFLSATMRKFLRGPRGMGILYVSKETLQNGYEPLMMDMHGAKWIDEFEYQPISSAKRFEDWEFSFALLMACKAAISYALDIGMVRIEQRNKLLQTYLLEQLKKRLPEARVLDQGKVKANLITIHIPGYEPTFLKNELLNRKINVSASTLGAGLVDFRRKGVNGALRISPHYYNTNAEIDICIDALLDIIKP